MPVKGDWKKTFSAAREMVRDSLKGSAYLAMDTIRKLAADTIILGGAKMVTNRSGYKKLAYIEVPGVTNMQARSSRHKTTRKIFHNTRYVSRSGNLLEQLRNAPITVKDSANGATATLTLNDKAGGALTQKKSGRVFAEITDKNGNIKTAQVRRRPLELAARKVLDLWNKDLKARLDKGARKIK